MNALRARPLAAAVVMLGLAVAAGGCGRKVWLTHYPDFYDAGLKTLAVPVFANHTAQPDAGKAVTDALVAALVDNGAYEVIAPEELAARAARAGVAITPRDAPDQIARKLRRIGGIDAVVLGSTGAWEAESYRHYGDECYPPYGYYYPYGYQYEYGVFGGGYGRRYFYGAWYYPGYPAYVHWHGEARVVAGLVLVRVADGEQLYLTDKPVKVDIEQVGDPPAGAPSALLATATDRVGLQLAGAIAPAPREVRIDESKALRTARIGPDGAVKTTNDLRPTDKTLHVIVLLPDEADRNAFRLRITRRSDGKELARADIRWRRGGGAQRVSFEIAELVSRADRARKYRVTLHARDQLVAKRDFEIKRD